ncbi:MAG: RAP domain-containing protein, partial [Myxococcota bacterium]
GQDNLNDKAKSQLYQVALYVQTKWPDLEFPLSDQLGSLRSAYTRLDAGPSQLQRDVSEMLAQLGWSHTFEHETVEGFSLDLADPDAKRAIEVDGPFHYLQDATTGEYVVNGATRFKSRLLRRLGWDVMHVPFFEWDALQGGEAQDTYLRSKLASSFRQG